MTGYLQIAALAILPVLLAPVAEARPTLLLDVKDPVASLVMNDGQNAGPIIQTDFSPPSLPALPPGAIVTLPSLGCANIDTNDMAGWDSIFTETDFFEPIIQTYTYFFDDAPSTRSFTLTASDARGIKRIIVSINERDVQTIWGTMISDDGPTEFFNVSPSRAVSYLQPIWISSSTSGPFFSHYEKRLLLEPPQNRLRTDVTLNFDLTTFGSTGRLRVIVEDNSGNVTYGAVFLAPDGTCW